MKNGLLLLTVTLVLSAGTKVVSANPADRHIARDKRPPLIAERSEENSRIIVALTDTRRYSLLAPRDWRINVEPAQKVLTFSSPEAISSSMTIRFQDGGRGLKMEQGRWSSELVSARPSAKLESTFRLDLSGSTSLVVDLVWTHADQMLLAGRFVCIPVPDGYLEVSLSCPNDQFESVLPVLMQLLGSIKIGSLDRPLEVPKLAVE